jgi:biofilm PGA synthesis N-glycosyltransferase PgaC
MSELAREGAASAESAPIVLAAVHLGLALICFVVLAVTQLFAFSQMGAVADRTHGMRSVALAIFASSFLVFTVVSLLRHGVLMCLAWMGASRAMRRRFTAPARWPTVSILVPAFNEAGRIEKALDSILATDYPGLEVVVVDDGSTDETFARVSRYGGRHGEKSVRVLRKPNGGKWSALNLAFHTAAGELVVCVDADSQLASDSLKLLARHFTDPALGACAGQVDVRNKVNFVTRMQALEYSLMNGIARQAQSAFGTVLVAPGPLAMFRRNVLVEVWKKWGRPQPLPVVEAPARVYGPWEDDTFAEDADLTLAVVLTGMAVTYEPRAVSHTAAPEWVFRLLNQRYRWTRGNLQAALKAWKRLPDAPAAPRSLPVWLGSLIFETIVWPAINLYGLLAFVLVLMVFGMQGPVVLWFVALTAIDLNTAAFSARLEGTDMKLLVLMPLTRVYFNLVLDVSKFFALYDELRGKRMSWS